MSRSVGPPLIAIADYELLTAAGNSSVMRCRIANSVHQMHEASGRILALAHPALLYEWKASPFPDCGNCIFLSRYLQFQELVADLLRRPVPVC